MKKYYFLLLVLLIFQNGFSQNDKKDYTEAFEFIEVWLEAQKDFEDLPGITASVVNDQEIAWSGSFGKSNLEGNVKADPSTLFSICSISKLFTAVAVMKLYDEGKLRLDDEIGELLPWFDLEQQFPESGPITVRSLLSHSSGLPREANFPYWTGPDFPFPAREEIREALKDQQTLYPSSTYFQYSNLALTLLGEIVEEVSGVPYDQYIDENILKPLRLQDTRTELPESLYGKQLAIGYGAVKREGGRDKMQLFQAEGIKPAAGFSSNVIDLSRFASWQFRLRDTTSTEILKPSTLKNMHNVHWLDPDWNSSWGLGFSVYKGPDGKKWVSHGGSCPGYKTVIQLNTAEKKAFVVMINANDANPGKYAKGIFSLMNKVKSSNNPEEKKQKDFSEYKGYYNPQPWSSEVYVSSWEGKLALLYLPTDSPADALTLFKHVKDDTFQRIRDDGEPGETLSFERDKNGKVYRFERHGNYTTKIERQN